MKLNKTLRMSSFRTRQACQRNTSACAIASLVLFMGLIIFVVIYVLVKHQVIELKSSTQDHMRDDCTSEATVVTDEVVVKKWETCKANFSQAWSNSEQHMRKPAHRYMDRRHSIALYVFTDMMMKSVTQKTRSPKRSETLKEIYEPHSLYSSLSEAIQMLRHSQVTCHRTSYRTETLLHLNISEQLRFSTFMLGLNERNFTSNGSCFESYSCFGADVTYYSALTQNKQVLIPPYEVFKVMDIQTKTKNCEVVYTLRSNMNCVYDRESNALHPISALPVEGFWLIFVIVCIIIISLFLPFVLMKLYHRKTADHTLAVFCQSQSVLY